MDRPSAPQTYMEIAKVWAKRSTCSARVAVGAVIVNKFGQVIASGYNGSPRGFPHCNDVGCDFDDHGHCRRAVHAELNAILQCARTGITCEGTFLYVTHSPCMNCSIMIVQSGIHHIFYDNVYGDISRTEQIFYQARIAIEPLGG